MSTRSKSHALCVAASMALLTIAPSSAYAFNGQSAQAGSAEERAEQRPNTAGRTGSHRDRRAQSRNLPPAPTPVQAGDLARKIVAGTGKSCEVGTANHLGFTQDGRMTFEASCANDFGYLLFMKTPSGRTTDYASVLVEETLAISCIEAKVLYDRHMAANPTADPASQPKCNLPENDNFTQVFANMAVKAGITCTVDEATLRGTLSGSGEPIYEIGCSNSDGYRLTGQGGGNYQAQSCLEMGAQGNCAFTTKEEQIATVSAWFTTSADPIACSVSDVRYMGGNANGSFYEAACNGTDGLIARLDAAKTVQQVYPCAEAANIGGGCKLTAGAPQGNNGAA